jgi:hypothetical protein
MPPKQQRHTTLGGIPEKDTAIVPAGNDPIVRQNSKTTHPLCMLPDQLRRRRARESAPQQKPAIPAA